MARRVPPAWLDEDPPMLSEGLSWYLKGPPPIHRVYKNGTIYETAYAPAPGEEAPAPPGGGAESPGTTVTFPIAAGADDQEVSKTGSSYPPTSAVTRNSTGENTQAERKYRSFSTPPVGWRALF